MSVYTRVFLGIDLFALIAASVACFALELSIVRFARSDDHDGVVLDIHNSTTQRTIQVTPWGAITKMPQQLALATGLAFLVASLSASLALSFPSGPYKRSHLRSAKYFHPLFIASTIVGLLCLLAIGTLSYAFVMWEGSPSYDDLVDDFLRTLSNPALSPSRVSDFGHLICTFARFNTMEEIQPQLAGACRKAGAGRWLLVPTLVLGLVLFPLLLWMWNREVKCVKVEEVEDRA